MNYNTNEVKTEKCYETVYGSNQCRVTGEICMGFKKCAFYKTKEQFQLAKEKRDNRLKEMGYEPRYYKDAGGVQRMGVFKDGKHIDFKDVVTELNKVVEVFTYITPMSVRS